MRDRHDDCRGSSCRHDCCALKERRINTVSSLREFGIYDFEAKGVETAVRLSPHYYNTEAEVEEAVSVIRELIT